MATTTNYGWETPDDTDLVKDGALAIRTLGSSIDTTTKNLNPETTAGDIAYRSSTSNVNTRLALGTANQVLRVNSGATAPEWATLAANTFVGCAVTKSAVQSINNSTTTTVTWNTETFDTDGFHDNVTNNSRLTIPTGKGGKYQFTGIINWNNNSTGYRECRINKNGSLAYIVSFAATPTGDGCSIITCIISMAQGDYAELQVEQSSGGALDVKALSTFQCALLGA